MKVSKRCTICGQEKPLSEFHRRRYTDKSGYRSACKDCTREKACLYRKRYREKHLYSEEERHKQAVRAKTRLAVEKGKLTPLPCAVCGSVETEAHHPSYEGPGAHLEVVWLCQTHHSLEHGKRAWTRQRELFLDDKKPT